jgi:hypothetical protein
MKQSIFARADGKMTWNSSYFKAESRPALCMQTGLSGEAMKGIPAGTGTVRPMQDVLR